MDSLAAAFKLQNPRLPHATGVRALPRPGVPGRRYLDFQVRSFSKSANDTTSLNLVSFSPVTLLPGTRGGVNEDKDCGLRAGTSIESFTGGEILVLCF